MEIINANIQDLLTWKSIQNRRDKFESSIVRLFDKALMDQIRQSLRVLPQITDISQQWQMMINAINEKPMIDPYEKTYTRVGSEFAKVTYRDLTGKRKKAIEQNTVDAWITWLANYTLTEAGSRIVSVTAFSKQRAEKLIRQIISQGASEGLGVDKIAELIEIQLPKAWRIESKFRSVRIARTEIVSASNAGSQLGADTTGYKMSKSWLSTMDQRTRDAHLLSNGQTVGSNDNFMVDGESLKYAGDPSGSAGNVINCRCTQTYKVL